jgi:hypothetical protein
VHVFPRWEAPSGSTVTWTRSRGRPSSRRSGASRTRGPVHGGEDARTAPQRRADALTELCRSWLDRSDRPEIAGERPHVVVTVDIESLRGRAGRRSELPDTGSVPPEAARRIACDAGVSRTLMRGPSEPVEIGRKTQIVPSGLRRALVLRDGGCRFPGCGRPQTWCDAHHVRHWADGGETGLRNLVLLCRRHHRAVHEGFRRDEGRQPGVRAQRRYAAR